MIFVEINEKAPITGPSIDLLIIVLRVNLWLMAVFLLEFCFHTFACSRDELGRADTV